MPVSSPALLGYSKCYSFSGGVPPTLFADVGVPDGGDGNGLLSSSSPVLDWVPFDFHTAISFCIRHVRMRLLEECISRKRFAEHE
jgi:hypothetical protein